MGGGTKLEITVSIFIISWKLINSEWQLQCYDSLFQLMLMCVKSYFPMSTSCLKKKKSVSEHNANVNMTSVLDRSFGTFI